MNIIMTTSGYILRFKNLITSKFISATNPDRRSRPGFATTDALNGTFTKENALHLLLDKGKSFKEAEMIIATVEDWGMELDQIAVLEFEVHGESVWIKAD
jgi:hypothetical protein